MNYEELEYGMKQLEYIEKEVEEIKKLNKKSSDILNSKNIFVRIFRFNEAVKLDEQAAKRMLEVQRRLSRLPKP